MRSAKAQGQVGGFAGIRGQVMAGFTKSGPEVRRNSALPPFAVNRRAACNDRNWPSPASEQHNLRVACSAHCRRSACQARVLTMGRGADPRNFEDRSFRFRLFLGLSAQSSHQSRSEGCETRACAGGAGFILDAPSLPPATAASRPRCATPRPPDPSPKSPVPWEHAPPGS